MMRKASLRGVYTQVKLSIKTRAKTTRAGGQ